MPSNSSWPTAETSGEAKERWSNSSFLIRPQQLASRRCGQRCPASAGLLGGRESFSLRLQAPVRPRSRRGISRNRRCRARGAVELSSSAEFMRSPISNSRCASGMSMSPTRIRGFGARLRRAADRGAARRGRGGGVGAGPRRAAPVLVAVPEETGGGAGIGRTRSGAAPGTGGGGGAGSPRPAPRAAARPAAPTGKQIRQRDPEIGGRADRNRVADFADRGMPCLGQRRVRLDRFLHRLSDTLHQLRQPALMALERSGHVFPRCRGQPLAQLGNAGLGSAPAPIFRPRPGLRGLGLVIVKQLERVRPVAPLRRPLRVPRPLRPQ